MPHISFI